MTFLDSELIISWTPRGFQIRTPMMTRPIIAPLARLVFRATMMAKAAPSAAIHQKDLALGATTSLMLSPIFVGSWSAAMAAAELTSITNAASAVALSVLRMLSLLSPPLGDVHLDGNQSLVDAVDSGRKLATLEYQ